MPSWFLNNGITQKFCRCLSMNLIIGSFQIIKKILDLKSVVEPIEKYFTTTKLRLDQEYVLPK